MKVIDICIIGHVSQGPACDLDCRRSLHRRQGFGVLRALAGADFKY